MFTLISYSDFGYSYIHQSTDFDELEKLKNDPSILVQDGLELNDLLLELGGVCGSCSMEDFFQDDDEVSNVHYLILDEYFIEELKTKELNCSCIPNWCECGEDCDLELCEMLANQYPSPSLLASTLQSYNNFLA